MFGLCTGSINAALWSTAELRGCLRKGVFCQAADRQNRRAPIQSSLSNDVETPVKPEVIYDILKAINVTHLHHANSIATTCTFLRAGALLSRAAVEASDLRQTPQSSDEVDKKFGIWGRVFLDHVDIHFRAGRAKGPNQYGPALFLLDREILLHLPTESDVLITKRNPIHWRDGEPDDQRWYESPDQLKNELAYGDFSKMLMIETPERKVDLPKPTVIAVDDPKRRLVSGEDAYEHAEACLQAASKKSGVPIKVTRHVCRSGCRCEEKYSKYSPKDFDSLFIDDR